MIIGIGIDITDNQRHEKFLDQPNKIKKLLSEEEEKVYNTFTSRTRQVEYLASRFCAKEALIKAMKKTLPLTEISVLSNEDGSPYIKLPFSYENIIHISLSHEEKYSTAIVIIEKNNS